MYQSTAGPDRALLSLVMLAPTFGAAAFIVLQLLGALCEEIGFRGVLFLGLLRWLPKWAATVIVGVLFGLWHVQYFALPAIEHVVFLLTAIVLTATMTYTMVGTFWWRMLTCSLIHLAANLALSFSSAVESSMMTFALAAAAGAVVAAVGVATHRRAFATYPRTSSHLLQQ